MAIVIGFWLCLPGCGKSQQSTKVTLKRVAVNGQDLATALGIHVFKFKVVSSVEAPVDVEFWAEDYTPSPAGPVTQTHKLRRWSGERLVGYVLLMLPGEGKRQYCFGVGNIVSWGNAPESMQVHNETGGSQRVPERIECQLGETITIAVEIYSDETTGADSDSIEDYVEENLRLGKYERIRVYKARFSLMGRKPGSN